MATHHCNLPSQPGHSCADVMSSGFPRKVHEIFLQSRVVVPLDHLGAGRPKTHPKSFLQMTTTQGYPAGLLGIVAQQARFISDQCRTRTSVDEALIHLASYSGRVVDMVVYGNAQLQEPLLSDFLGSYLLSPLLELSQMVCSPSARDWSLPCTCCKKTKVDCLRARFDAALLVHTEYMRSTKPRSGDSTLSSTTPRSTNPFRALSHSPSSASAAPARTAYYPLTKAPAPIFHRPILTRPSYNISSAEIHDAMLNSVGGDQTVNSTTRHTVHENSNNRSLQVDSVTTQYIVQGNYVVHNHFASRDDPNASRA